MVVEALDVAWRAWAELGRGLGEEQWHRPTRLDGWSVKAVFAHYSPWPGIVVSAAEAPPCERPLTHAGAAELLAAWNEQGGVAHAAADDVRRAAIDSAESHTISDLVEPFTAVAPRAVELLRSVDLDRPLDYFGLAVVPHREGVRIGLMEAVVHYFDLASALGWAVPGPMAGEPVRITSGLLADIADPVALIHAATGRGASDVFPVLR